jgi:hypothetical protein
MSLTSFDIEFTRDGALFDPNAAATLLGALPDATDLIVLAHGWNNDKAEAGQLFDALCGNLAKLMDIGIVPGLDGRRVAVLRVFWPSKRFAEADLIPGGGAASAGGQNDEALKSLLEALRHDPLRLGGDETDPLRSLGVDALLALLPALDADAAARRSFVLQLRALLDPSAAHAEDGSLQFFGDDPEALFDRLQGPVAAAPAAASGGGGATALAGGGSAAGLGDLLSGAMAAARRIANFGTYYEMKRRAGTVGTVGLAPLLRQLREANPALRLHLVGHSFGGRLVTAAALKLPDASPAVTLSLLQAAYSHNGLASRYDGQNDGAFRAVLAQARVSGPVLITHTRNDRAVGLAYPLASFVSREQAADVGDQNDPYGGMGRNGAQHTPEVAADADTLVQVGLGYDFSPGKVYNLNADAFIADHGDVTGPQVAYAVLNAVRAV